ncbi:MAG: DNA alkylation repair protein [Actinobacteria bacterium]|nr:DNA alkylation repair protein [Actinomycetota bacterium]
MKPAAKPFNENEFVAGLRISIEKQSNSRRAKEMAAYMLDQFDFAGVNAPARTEILRDISVQFEKPNQKQIVKVMRMLWDLEEREYQMLACEFLNRNKKSLSASFVSTHVKYFIINKSWWDSVDSLRPAVGYVVSENRELDKVIFEWIESDNKWLVRSALIHQLVLKEKVDPKKLFALCDRRKDDTEFFIAKAVGWALRDYSYVSPVSVKKFIEQHQDLTPLARREGLKAINRKAARRSS